MEKKEGIKMEFETLKKSHKREILIGAVVFILIAIVLIVRASFAKYQTTKNVTIAEGTVNYKVPDFKIMAMYKNDGDGDVEITEMPESGYTINESKSYCNLNGSKDNNAKLYTDESGNHIISKLTKGDKCYLYFDKKPCKGAECILPNVTVNEGTPDFGTTATTDEGVYKAIDESGKDSYYFRGAVTNNYVKFANKFWRIIRINGDGTIRIIYDGESARPNGISSDTTQIGTIAFNTSYSNNMHVGFKYTSGQVHGIGTKSNILSSTETAGLETWYKANLESYASKIDIDAGFCGDRTSSSKWQEIDNLGGTGTTTTYYGAYIREEPILTCPTEDFYTISVANKGNKSLTYPIGLITADEVIMAGARKNSNNSSYYLYTGQGYWTISPYIYTSGNAYPATIFIVDTTGMITYRVNLKYGVRPVINLKADVTLTGKGTASDPYVVS